MDDINQRKFISKLRDFFSKQLNRLRMTEYTFMVILAMVIGVLGGFGAIIFRYGIRFFQYVFFGSFSYSLDYALGLPWYVKLLAPAVGGLIVGPIVFYFAREAKGHGVPEVMESIVFKGGAIRFRVMFAKIVGSAVSIGSGGSVGREGPIVQIGSGLGSSIGQLLKVTGSKLRTLVACGASAGIAATFNAPVAGALFSAEIILSDFGFSQFSPIVISSVAATVVSRHFLGDSPAFEVPQYDLVSVYEMIPYIILGVLSAFVALAFINILYKSEDLFDRLKIPSITKPMLGGLILGTVGIFFPHIFGVGYDTIGLALGEKLAWYFLLVLLFLKLFATSVTLGTGGSGGIFAPSLFMGAALGGFVGTIVHTIMPESSATSGAYALVGMGAVVAGATHAPITAIVMIFELTGDYRIILPLMVTCIISLLITRQLKRDSIYSMKLTRRGVNLFGGREVNVLRSLKVAQVMNDDYESIYADTPFRKLLDLTVKSPHPDFFVVDKQNNLIGVISVHDIRKIIYDSDSLAPLLVAHDLISPAMNYLTPDDTLDMAMKAFEDAKIDELPVVNGEQGNRLISTVTKSDVIEAYNKEILKRDMLSSFSDSIKSLNRFKRVELMGGQMLCELEVPGSFVNKTLRELNLRKKYGLEVVMIRKNYDPEKKEREEVITPNPDYRLKFGDSMLVIGTKNCVNKLKGL